ncbi:MAG: Flp family type IVb pilin [Rickettsiales bacterium]|nr:Flp family type IVb pilin [Rickettsiales bacterium]
MTLLKQFFCDETGATLIEYGLIAALIALTAVLSMQNLGLSLNTRYNGIAQSVTLR